MNSRHASSAQSDAGMVPAGQRGNMQDYTCCGGVRLLVGGAKIGAAQQGLLLLRGVAHVAGVGADIAEGGAHGAEVVAAAEHRRRCRARHGSLRGLIRHPRS